jgi:hypothetical protein
VRRLWDCWAQLRVDGSQSRVNIWRGRHRHGITALIIAVESRITDNLNRAEQPIAATAPGTTLLSSTEWR